MRSVFHMGQLRTNGFAKLSDFAGRWSSATECREKGPGKLDFSSGSNGFNEDSAELASIRLAHAWEDASYVLKKTNVFFSLVARWATIPRLDLHQWSLPLTAVSLRTIT